MKGLIRIALCFVGVLIVISLDVMAKHHGWFGKEAALAILVTAFTVFVVFVAREVNNS